MQKQKFDLFYTGKVVVIRPLLPSDSSLLHNWMYKDFFFYYKPYLKSICPTPSLIAQRIEFQSSLDPPFEVEALISHRHSNEPIGLIALTNIDSTNLKAEFSIAFNNGLGTKCVVEAIDFVIQQVFSVLNFNKLYFYVTADNYKILKMVKRYSLKHEGLLYEELLSENGEWLDLYRFCILRRDWVQNPIFKKLSILKERFK